MRRVRRAIVAGLMLGVAAVAPVPAGTVQLTVRDEDGGRIAGVKLALVPAQSANPFVRSRYMGTDRAGEVVIEGVKPGQYRIRLRGPGRDLYVDPEHNPFVSVPLVTIEREDQTVSAELALWRGVEVVCRAVYEGRRTPTVRARFREVDHGQHFDLVLRDGAERGLRVVPGRWEIVLEPPQGYLLTDVEVNGRGIDGHVAPLELESPAPPSYVTWYFAAPAELTGRVTFENEEVGVTIVARLVEAGPWLDAVLRRGGSAYQVVEARIDELGLYEMTLPDGRWHVQATGKWVAGADPEVADLVLAPGDSRTQDFHVRDQVGEGAGILLVGVRDPDGKRVSGATVEVWPADPAMRGTEPVAREKVRWAFAYVRGLSAGRYVVAAAAPGFVEGHVEVGYSPKEDEEREPAVVRLRRGATVHVVVDDEKGERASGVELTLERHEDDEVPEPLVTEPELARLAERHDVETDATGHAWIRGVWFGRYELRGRTGGRGSKASFVRFPGERGRMTESVELTLADGDEVEVAARVVPAATITGQLVCTDGRPIPGLVAVAVLRAGVDPATLDDGNPMTQALLALPEVPLGGRLRDTFSAGPLEHGAYLVAVQPAGHDRWTWVPGTERVDEATPIQALPGDAEGVGTVGVDCGPAIRLRPLVASADPLPDLREKLPDRPIAEARGTVVHEIDGERKVRRVTVDPYPDRVLLRDLPEGEAELVVTLYNGYFVPGPAVTVQVEATLERGRTVDVYPAVGSIGGMLRVRQGVGAAARLSDVEESSRLAEIVQGRAEFRSLVPGPYRLELCADADCRAVRRSWEGVDVEMRTTLEVTPAELDRAPAP